MAPHLPYCAGKRKRWLGLGVTLGAEEGGLGSSPAVGHTGKGARGGIQPCGAGGSRSPMAAVCLQGHAWSFDAMIRGTLLEELAAHDVDRHTLHWAKSWLDG